jgi:hypothetical protein
MQEEFWHFTVGNLLTILTFLLGGSGPLAWLIRTIAKERRKQLNRIAALETEVRTIREALHIPAPPPLPAPGSGDASQEL